MSKSALREAMTGVGVILSLVFVAFEIRENTEAVRSATIQGIADQSIEVSMGGLQSPELRAAMRKANLGALEEMSADEDMALRFWYAAVLRIAENRFRQAELGTISDASIVGGANATYRNPYFARYWEARSHEFPHDFVAHVEATLLPLVQAGVEPVDLSTRN